MVSPSNEIMILFVCEKSTDANEAAWTDFLSKVSVTPSNESVIAKGEREVLALIRGGCGAPGLSKIVDAASNCGFPYELIFIEQFALWSFNLKASR